MSHSSAAVRWTRSKHRARSRRDCTKWQQRAILSRSGAARVYRLSGIRALDGARNLGAMRAYKVAFEVA